MEIWELFNSDGTPSGVMWERGRRDEMPVGLYHKVVEVWVSLGDKILLTQRHPDKWGGLLWEASGGAVLVGEDVRQAAVRELAEETGILASAEEICYLGRWKSSRAMIESFVLYLTELPPLTLQESEVVGAKTVTAEELESMLDTLTDGSKTRYGIYKSSLFKNR